MTHPGTGTESPRARSLSLITPSGDLTLGNLLGALGPMTLAQHASDGFYGVADLHAMTTTRDPAEPEGLTTYGALKRAVTDAVVAELEPLQRRYAELAGDSAYVDEVLEAGASRCREVTAPLLVAVEEATGL